MAIYVSAARRARRTVVIAVLAALVAFAIGWAFGRQQVPSIDDRVASVQDRAGDLATNIERLDIEYEQVVVGGDAEASGTDSVEAGVIAPLDDLRTELQSVMDDAPWLGTTQRSAMLDALAEMRSEALDGVPLDTFVATAATAADLVRATFAVPA